MYLQYINIGDKNLLTIVKPGDVSHYLLINFLKSLPNKTKKIFDAYGFIGNLEENLNKIKDKNTRRFTIFRSDSFKGLVTDYFSSTPEAAVKEIEDELTVKVDYKQEDTDIFKGAREIIGFKGTIDEMVEKYKELSSTDPRQLLNIGLKQSEFIRKYMTRAALFGFGKRKIVPTYVSVGIETPDGKYLLETTGAQGPYIGILIDCAL